MSSRPSCYVHLLPTLVARDALIGGKAVIIDVLRASTTIVHALDNGAEAILPFETVEEARAAHDGDANLLSGGERGGVKIDGFDLGNSPLEYTADIVAGRSIALTTTNGTRALLHARAAERVVVGCFANLSAIGRELHDGPGDAHLVCAGTDGEVTAEDVLCAGALCAYLQSSGFGWQIANDVALLAVAAWERHGTCAIDLENALCLSRGGRNLRALGFHLDIKCAAMLEMTNMVPRYDAVTGRIGPHRT